MKLSSLTKVMLCSVSGVALLASVAQAEPGKRSRTKRPLVHPAPEQYVMVTGSNIPQKVGTPTSFNVRIYSRRDLLSTGRQTAGEALAVLDPSVQISGR